MTCDAALANRVQTDATAKAKLTETDRTATDDYNVVSLLELASPGAQVRFRGRVGLGELDNVRPDGTGREEERRVGYPLAILEHDLSTLSGSCLCDGDDLSVLDLAVPFVEEVLESEKRLVLQALLRGDGDTRHSGEIAVEGTRVDEDDLVLGCVELLRELAADGATSSAAADDDDVLLVALLGHFVRVRVL